MADAAKVLAVDDDPHTRGLLSELLESMGYAVQTACDGEEALVAVASFRPDAVLLDVTMPKLDGFAVLSRLRGDEATRDLPVLLVTAIGELHGKLRWLGGGATDYLTKPFRLHELQARLEVALSLAKTKSALREAEERLHAAGLGGSPGTFAELREALQYELGRARRYGRTLGAIVLELSGLPDVQAAGGRDAVLTARDLALTAIREALRETDRLFDIGDDELVLLLPETDRAGVESCGQRIVMGIALTAPGLTGHFGLAAFPEVPFELAAALLQAAEADLERRRG